MVVSADVGLGTGDSAAEHDWTKRHSYAYQCHPTLGLPTVLGPETPRAGSDSVADQYH
jgi:hypothetical protein